MDKHRTKEGVTIGIPEMEDSHLRNTIYLFIDRMKEVTAAMHQDNLKQYVITEGVEFDVEDAKRAFQSLKDKLKRYLYEATLRGMADDELAKKLQEAHGRSGRIIDFPRPVVTGNKYKMVAFDDLEDDPEPF